MIAMVKPRRVARLSIGGRAVAALRWHALYQGAVERADSFTEETVAVRCQTREDAAGWDREQQWEYY